MKFPAREIVSKYLFGLKIKLLKPSLVPRARPVVVCGLE